MGKAPHAACSRPSKWAALELGYKRARLDTGDRQPAAQHLYEATGYFQIPAYNANNQATMWFEKEL